MGLRRWRHNPLCRPTDLAEAWVALVALLLICFAAPATGWVCGALTDASLQRTARLQQAERHAATATVLGPAPGRPAGDAEPATRHRMREPVLARWAAPDGTPRTGTLTPVRNTAGPGESFRVWTDDRGRPVNPPMTADSAREHAVLAGIGAAVGAAGVTEGARRLVVRQLVRRRYARLDRAWAQAGPDWGRTGADS
ncbi:hypothetical protein ACLGI4_26135 [Streptomyces sp. HMX112]|uniref:Rv1733c family protein n=1 Tax=Streptomyces sp. HMX112 TaxID=3390850 RepID=UPI003A7F63C1